MFYFYFNILFESSTIKERSSLQPIQFIVHQRVRFQKECKNHGTDCLIFFSLSRPKQIKLLETFFGSGMKVKFKKVGQKFIHYHTKRQK